jgi:hypothetical protein
MVAGIEFGIDGEPIPNEPQADSRPPELPGNTPVTEDGVLHEGQAGFDEANAQAFGTPPAGPWEYNIQMPDVADSRIELDMRQALFDEGIPLFVVGVANRVIEQNTKAGIVGDLTRIEGMKESARAELTRRHGEAAEQIIANASSLFQRLDKRNPVVCDLICTSGMGVDPNFIESLARVAQAQRTRKGA